MRRRASSALAGLTASTRMLRTALMVIALASCSNSTLTSSPPTTAAVQSSPAIVAPARRIEITIRPAIDFDHQIGELADQVRHLSFEGMGSQLVARRLDGVRLQPTDDGSALSAAGGVSACLLELDPVDARRFGDDPAALGFADIKVAPESRSMYLSVAVASQLGVAAGDTLLADGHLPPWQVQRVLPLGDVVGTCAGILPSGTVATWSESSASALPVGVIWIDVLNNVDPVNLIPQLRDALGSTWPKLDITAN